MTAVVWTEVALAQLDAIRAYVAQFNPGAAAGLAAELIAVSRSLRDFPHRGRVVPGTTMREIVTGYPYIIRYRVSREGEVRILRVRHAARRETRVGRGN